MDQKKLYEDLNVAGCGARVLAERACLQVFYASHSSTLTHAIDQT